MTFAAFVLSLWFLTVGLAAGAIIGYRLRQREERKSGS